MLYDDIERELMANAIQKNMRQDSLAVLQAITSTVDGYLSDIDFTGLDILDIGPGQCDFLDIARKRGANTFGVDFDPAVVKLGEKRGHHMTQCDLTKAWPFPDRKFDGIFCRGSINNFWFSAKDMDRLTQMLEGISGSLKPSAWLWIMPWNNYPQDHHRDALTLSMRTLVETWAKRNGIRVDAVGGEEKKRFGLHYTLPYLETWTRHCATPIQRDLLRDSRWTTPTSANAAVKPGSNYSDYENFRKRILAGTTVEAERKVAAAVLQAPDDLVQALEATANGDAQAIAHAYAAFIASRPSSDVLYSYLVNRIGGMTQARLYKSPGTKARTYSWGWTYWGRAAVFALNCTGERRFADLVLDGYERLLNERDDSLGMTDEFRHRVVKTWGVHTPEESPLRAAEITSTGLMLLPVCDLLLSPHASGLTEATRTRLVQSVTDALDVFEGELEIDEATGGGFYRTPFDGEVEALNHTHAFAAALVKAYQLTNDRKYLDACDRITKFFRAACTVEDNEALTWAYAPVPGQMTHEHAPMDSRKGIMTHRIGGEAFFKAAVTLEFPVAARSAGVCFEDDDIDRIANMFMHNVLQPGDSLNMYISKWKLRPMEEVADKYQAQIALVGGFSLLDDIRPEIRRELVRLVGARPAWFPFGWFSGPASVMALSRLYSNSQSRLDD